MTKKYKVLFVLITFLLSLFPFQVGAEIENDIRSLQEILGTEKGNQMIKKIDMFIEKETKSKASTLILESIVAKKTIALQKKEERNKQEEISRIVLGYIWQEVTNQKKEKLISGEKNEKEEGLKKEEQDRVNTTIIGIQKTFLGTLPYSNIHQSGSEFRGKFGIQTRLEQPFIGKIMAEILWDNIFGKIKKFDTELSGKLKIDVNQDEQRKGFSGNIHFIEKDSEQFIKIENGSMNGTGQILDDIFSSEITKIMEKNKFIRIKKNTGTTMSEGDSVFGEGEGQLKKIFQQDIPNYLSIISNKSLFTAHKKIGATYILVPSIDFCTLIQNISSGKSEECDPREYEFMLKIYEDTGITIGMRIEGQKIIFTTFAKEDPVEMFGQFELINNMIDSISLDIIPNQNEYKNEGISLEYREKKLNVHMHIESLILGAKISGDRKNFGGEYSFSVGGQISGQGDIYGSIKDNKTKNLKITLDGKNTSLTNDTFSGTLEGERNNTYGLIISGEGAYKQEMKEIFFGKGYYQGQEIKKETIQIDIPPDFIDIEELGNESTTDTIPVQ